MSTIPSPHSDSDVSVTDSKTACTANADSETACKANADCIDGLLDSICTRMKTVQSVTQGIKREVDALLAAMDRVNCAIDSEWHSKVNHQTSDMAVVVHDAYAKALANCTTMEDVAKLLANSKRATKQAQKTLDVHAAAHVVCANAVNELEANPAFSEKHHLSDMRRDLVSIETAVATVKSGVHEFWVAHVGQKRPASTRPTRFVCESVGIRERTAIEERYRDWLTTGEDAAEPAPDHGPFAEDTTSSSSDDSTVASRSPQLTIETTASPDIASVVIMSPLRLSPRASETVDERFSERGLLALSSPSKRVRLSETASAAGSGSLFVVAHSSA